MFVKVSQTRHTKIGTLRPGVYEKAKLGADGAKVIKALIEAEDPALKEISKKEAEAELDKVKSLMPTKVESVLLQSPTPMWPPMLRRLRPEGAQQAR